MNALIVDDERIARAELRRLLAAHADIAVVGEAKNGQEAIELIEKTRADLLFLDIQMPGLTGFAVLERLERSPQVIFTTAFDKYAVRAFEANALDYLLKPIAPDRLAVALAKLRPVSGAPLERLFVRDGERCWLVQTGEIQLLEADGNYTRLYFRGEKPTLARSLTSLEEKLDPKVFFRASRQHIVNLNAVAHVDAGVGDNLIVHLRGGPTIEMSRRQSSRLRDVLGV